jgi:hypothetical protein
MKVLKQCKCGNGKLVMFPPTGFAPDFGLPEGTLGNPKARFIKAKCPECNAEYVAECKPIPGMGGVIQTGKLFDMGEDKPEPQAEPRVPKPRKPKEEVTEVKDGVMEL